MNDDEFLKEISQTKTYSITAWHAQEVKRIGLALNLSDAEVVRKAIEELAGRVFDNGLPEPA